LTPMTLLPGMLKNVGGYPDTIIGYVLGLRGMGTAIAFLLMIYLSRFNPKILLICGFACQGVAGWQMAQLGPNISLWDIALPLWLQGFGVGLLWVPLTLISFTTLKPEFMAEGSGIYHFLRNMGGSIHISLSIAVVLRMKQTSYTDMTSQVTPFNEAFSLPWAAGGWSIETTKGMAAMTKEMTRQAIMVGYIDAFYFFVATVLLSVPLIIFVRWHKPKS
jgi:DHA2 family multidrug resistance protein